MYNNQTDVFRDWLLYIKTSCWFFYITFLHHSGIGRSPFKAMFGKEASLGAQHLNLESGIAKHIANEEDIHNMLPREVVYSFLIVIYNSILKLE